MTSKPVETGCVSSSQCSITRRTFLQRRPQRNSFPLRTKHRDQPSGGARRDRTDDLMLAKHALSQLSYGPISESRPFGRRPSRQLGAAFAASKPCGLPKLTPGVRAMDHSIRMVGLGGLEPPTSRLSSARSNQLSYKPELSAYPKHASWKVSTRKTVRFC